MAATPAQASATFGGPPTAAPGSSPSYRVARPEGETMLDIAQRTLGNGYRWKEILEVESGFANGVRGEGGDRPALAGGCASDGGSVIRT